jgi:hypothetical protein
LTGSIQVLVRDKETQQTAILTYKAFRDTAYRFDLIGQVDDNGNLMESDPNLSPQHQRKVPVKSPAAADAGETIASRSINALNEAVEFSNRFGAPANSEPAPIIEAATNANSDSLASSDGTSTSNLDVFHVEQSPEAVSDRVQEPIKERKKPGPKPKNKDL